MKGTPRKDGLSKRHGLRSSDNGSNLNDAATKASEGNRFDGTPDSIAVNSTTAQDMTGGEAEPGFPVTSAENYGANYDSSAVTIQEGASTSGADFLEPTNVVLPTTAWGHHTVLVGNLHNFVFMEVRLSQSASPCSAKGLHLEEGRTGKFQVKAFAFDRKVELPELPNSCKLKVMKHWRVVSKALEAFGKVNLCAGGQAESKFSGVHPECAYVDKTRVWRHNRCALVEQVREQCSSCASLNNTLRIHKVRLEKRKKELRVRIPLSPSKKPKNVQLRKQRTACYRSKLRLLKSKQKLKAELSACQRELKLLGEDGLQAALKRSNLPEAQRMLIMECVPVAKMIKAGPIPKT